MAAPGIDTWPVEMEEVLVEMWAERPCLYAVASPDYSDRDKKEKAVMEMAANIGKSGISVDFNRKFRTRKL